MTKELYNAYNLCSLYGVEATPSTLAPILDIEVEEVALFIECVRLIEVAPF